MTAPVSAKSVVPSPKSQKKPAGLAIVTSSGSLLVEPLNDQQVPGTVEVQLESAICVAVNLAVGGLLPMVRVSVPTAPTAYWGITFALTSTNFRSETLRDAVVLPDLIISKATLARTSALLVKTAP